MVSFYSYSQTSEIFQKVIEALEKHQTGKYRVIKPNDSTFTQTDFLLSLFRDDAVIVDCTIPKDLETHSVYPIITAQINMLDHILILSETDLPINIKPLREPYLLNSSNQCWKREKKLADWLNENLEDIYLNQNLIENPSERIPVKSIQDLVAHKDDMERMQEHSINYAIKRIKGENKKNVLISYRSKYYNNDFEGNVIPLKARIRPINYQENYQIHIFEPQCFCSGDEILTPMRRWMLVGMLDDRIRLMDEVWIYYTPDYFDSWWTIAELVAVSYYNATTGKNKPVIVRIYNPESRLLMNVDLKKDLKLDMNEENELGQRAYIDKMARLMANTRPDIMAPEAREDIQRIKSLASLLQKSPGFIRRFILRRIRKNAIFMSRSAMPNKMNVDEKNEIIQKIAEMYSNPQTIIEYANDEVFSNDFWYRLSYNIGKSEVHSGTVCLSSDKFTLGVINLKKYFDSPMTELINFYEKDFQEHVGCTTQVQIKDCNGIIINGEIKSVTTLFLWHATRMGVSGGQLGSGIEPLKVFHFTPN